MPDDPPKTLPADFFSRPHGEDKGPPATLPADFFDQPKKAGKPEIPATRAAMREKFPFLSEAQVDQYFKNQAMAKPKRDPGFLGTLGTDVINLAAPIVQSAMHPIQAIQQLGQVPGAIAQQQKGEFAKAKELRKQHRPVEAFGHELAGTVPVVGPAAAQAGEEFAEGRPGAGWAHTLELLGPEVAKGGLGAGKKILGKKVPIPQVEIEAIESVKPHVDLSVGQRTHSPGLQKIERGVLTHLPGSERRATDFFLRQQEQLGARGRQLAAETGGVQTNPYGSGQAVQQRLTQRINRLKGYADQIYDSVRKETAAAKQTVQTGTEQVPGPRPQATLTPGGMPRTVPVYSVLETPVELAPMRKALQPIYEDLTRAMPEARRANSPAYAALKDLMTTDQTHMNAMDFDRSLSAIKALARDGESPFLSTKSQRVAKQIIAEGETQLKQALGKVSPDLETKLAKGRNAVRSYHETAELLQDLHSEPAALYHNLTTGGDRVVDTLKDLNRMAPGELRTVGRTYLEGMIDKATAEGGFSRSAGVMADWRRMGPETKNLMFGPKLTKELDQFFLAAKKLAPAEGSATAGRMAAFAPYALAGEVVRSVATGGLEMGIKELAGGIGATYVLPNIAARVLFTPGGASLLTRALTSPVGSAAFREAARAVGARAALAQKQERADREKKPAATPTPAAGPPRASVEPTGRRGDYRQALTAAGERHGVPPALLHTVAQIESSGNPRAVSPKGATGLMQLMPTTARQYGVKDIRDVFQNIEGSARLLSHLWRKYQGNVPLVLAAYNAGEGAVDRHRGVPPYRETQEYVRRGMSRMRRAG